MGTATRTKSQRNGRDTPTTPARGRAARESCRGVRVLGGAKTLTIPIERQGEVLEVDQEEDWHVSQNGKHQKERFPGDSSAWPCAPSRNIQLLQQRCLIKFGAFLFKLVNVPLSTWKEMHILLLSGPCSVMPGKSCGLVVLSPSTCWLAVPSTVVHLSTSPHCFTSCVFKLFMPLGWLSSE